MFSQAVFRQDFSVALEQELARKKITIRELAELAGIPPATIYKITSGGRDPRFSTVKAIVGALEPQDEGFIGVIAAKFLLDGFGKTYTFAERDIQIRGYAAHTMDECIIAAVRAEKEGAAGIICAPILSSIIERIVDIPVVIVKPKNETFYEAFETIARRV